MPVHEFKFYQMFCLVKQTIFAIFHINVNAEKEYMKLCIIMTPTRSI